METQRHATKVAIVTGAGSCIGLATVVRLAREDARVVVTDINPVHLERLGPIHAAGRRMAEPNEVATLISWLASDEASNVNGAVIPVDGGWSAG